MFSLYLLSVFSAFAVVAANNDGKNSSSGNLAGYDTSRVGPANAHCKRETYQLNVTSNNIVFQNVDSDANATYITALLQTAIDSPANLTAAITAPNRSQVTNSLFLSGILCTPLEGPKNASEVQFLANGFGYDSGYWDFTVDGSDRYSYISAATAAGWTTFRYDRLGTGLSEHPQDAYNVVQSPTDLAIATEFATMLRNGQINGTTFTRIVGIGHGYAAVQMQALSATAPQLLDALVLTGFSADPSPSFAPGAYASAQQVAPQRYGATNLSDAYLQNGLISGTQLDFFYWPGFEQATLDRSFAIAQPVTQGVLFSLGGLIQNATNFTGPVQIVTGAKDLPYCNRDCYNVQENSTYSSIPAAAQQLYPNAKNFSVYIADNTGHGINTHLSAPQSFQVMLSFIENAFATSS